MRILMITDFYPPFLGGVENLVSTLSRELAARGHRVAVATLAAPDLPADELADGVRVRRIRASAQRARGLFATEARTWAPPTPDPEAMAALRALVSEERPDVVHGHDWLARSYLPLKRRRGPALAMSLHYYTLTCPKKNLMYDGTPCTGPALVKCLRCAGRHYGRAKGTVVVLGERAFAPLESMRVDLFLPVSEASAAGNGLTRGRLPYEVVPNPVPAPDAVHPHLDLLAELPTEPFLLFVGDVRGDKGIDILIDAYANLDHAPPLVVIGKIWPESPPLPPEVRLLRYWPNAAVRAAMARCLTLVAPSVLPEPFGLVVAEALTAGRPVVASRIGGIPEIVRDGVEGLLVPPADPGALARALERIVGDAALRERLAANARRRARDFSTEAIVPRFEAAYARIAG
jgi:glycosyltransferase involved in cell wall biosynthesis